MLTYCGDHFFYSINKYLSFSLFQNCLYVKTSLKNANMLEIFQGIEQEIKVKGNQKN